MEFSQITLTAKQLELLPMPLEWFCQREFQESVTLGMILAAEAAREMTIDDLPAPDHVLGG